MSTSGAYESENAALEPEDSPADEDNNGHSDIEVYTYYPSKISMLYVFNLLQSLTFVIQ